MKRYAIFGVGGCGRGVMPLARRQLEACRESFELVFVDDHHKAGECNGHRVVRFDEWLNESATDRVINLAIANGKVRESLAYRCSENSVDFFEIRADNVVQLDDTRIGEGAILCPFVTVTSNVNIGRHFHANLYSYVEHDSVIGDYVTFGPAVKCNGNVVIEDHVYVGAGAIIKNGKTNNPLIIGRSAVIGMGAVVTDDVPPGVTVVGNPARILLKT